MKNQRAERNVLIIFMIFQFAHRTARLRQYWLAELRSEEEIKTDFIISSSTPFSRADMPFREREIRIFNSMMRAA
jgi:hypothetical protein